MELSGLARIVFVKLCSLIKVGGIRRDFTSIVVGGTVMLMLTQIIQLTNNPSRKVIELMEFDVSKDNGVTVRRLSRELPTPDIPFIQACEWPCLELDERSAAIKDEAETEEHRELTKPWEDVQMKTDNSEYILLPHIFLEESGMTKSDHTVKPVTVRVIHAPAPRNISHRPPTKLPKDVKLGDLHPPKHPTYSAAEEVVIKVALGISITSKELHHINSDNIRDKFVFFKSFLPSFCDTRNQEMYFAYTFYLAYDFNDAFFADRRNRTLFTAAFQAMINDNCLDTAPNQYIWIKLVRCGHSSKPAWAQNDAMMDAYLDNYDYYYRLSDDVTLTSENWTSRFINKLKSYNPSNVGMVAPTHRGQRPDLFTFDFVHRTHIDIFGYYYPRVFLNSFTDEWIGQVYSHYHKCQQISDVTLSYPETMGKTSDDKVEGDGNVRHMFRTNEQTRGKETLNRFISYYKRYGPNHLHKTDGRIIAMSLAGNNPDDLWGAVRNVFLAKVFFPAFNVRFYIANPDLKNAHSVDDRFLSLFLDKGAQLKQVPTSFTNSVPVPLWKYLAIDDGKINYLMLRDPASRLTLQDTTHVSEFIGHVQHKLVTCFRDFLPKSTIPLEDNRITFKLRPFRMKLQAGKKTKSMYDEIQYFLHHHTQASASPDSTTTAFLQGFLWPRLRTYIYVYDSTVDIDIKESYVHPIPKKMLVPSSIGKWTYIGRKYDAFDTLPDVL